MADIGDIQVREYKSKCEFNGVDFEPTTFSPKSSRTRNSSLYIQPEAPEATQGNGGRISKKGTFTLLGKQEKGNF